MKESTLNIICRHPLFECVDRKILTDYIKPFCREEEVRSGEMIHYSDSEFKGLGIIISGEAEARSADIEKNILLRRLEQGDLFGVATLFDQSHGSVSIITAIKRCKVLYIEEKAISELLLHDERFLKSYIGFLSGRIRFLNRKIMFLSSGSADRRFALYIASFDGDRITPDLKMNSIADLLGIGRASLYRAIEFLGEKGLIIRDGNSFIIPDRNKLNEFYNIK